MAYGIHDLELKGLQVKTILSVHISHKPGEHGVMELTRIWVRKIWIFPSRRQAVDRR